MLSQEIYNVTEDRSPRSGFGQIQNTRQRIQPSLLVMACFRNKTSSPLFLVDESAEKMQSFIPLKIPSAVVWQLWLLDWSFLSIQTENSGYWFPRTECVRNVAWWKFLVDFFPFKYVWFGMFVFLLLKRQNTKYKTCHPKWRKFKSIFEFYTWIFSKAK